MQARPHPLRRPQGHLPRSMFQPGAVERLEHRTLLSTSWPAVDTYAGPDMENFAMGMTADAAGNVYAVGTSDNGFSNDGVIREKLNGSNTWTEILHLTNNYLFGVAVDARGDVYACGRRFGFHWLVVERKAGESDFKVVDDSGTTSGQCEGLTTDSLGNVYAAGFLSVPTTKGANTTYTHYWAVRKQAGGAGPFTTVDQFDVKSSYYMDSDAHPRGAVNIASGPTAGLYVAGDDAGKWVVRKSLDAGKTWATVDPGYVYPSNPGSAGALGIAGDAFGNVYVAGHADTRTLTGYTGKGNKTPVYKTTEHWVVRKSSNGGASWAVVDDYLLAGSGSAAAWSLAADGAGTVYVAGRGIDASGTTGHALVRANTGTDAHGTPNGSWVTLADNTGTTIYGADNYACTIDAGGTVYAAGADYDSSGNGQWVVRSPAVAAALAAPAAASPAPATFSTTPIATGPAPAVRAYAPHTDSIVVATANSLKWLLEGTNGEVSDNGSAV